MKTIYIPSNAGKIENIPEKIYEKFFLDTINPRKMETIVVKTGSALSNPIFAYDLAQSLCEMRERYGTRIILVPSGTVKQGAKLLDERYNGFHGENHVVDKQAKAAFGVSSWANMWSTAFLEQNYGAAVILLTNENLDQKNNPEQYEKCLKTIDQCLSYRRGIVIANENDTVSTGEISFGDNDNLSSLLAVATNADCLFTLTKENGLYTMIPKDKGGNVVEDAKLINVVCGIDDYIRGIAKGETDSAVSTGGMDSKVNIAANRMTTAGKPMLIANGERAVNPFIGRVFRKKNPVEDHFLSCFYGGTLFLPKQ